MLNVENISVHRMANVSCFIKAYFNVMVCVNSVGIEIGIENIFLTVCWSKRQICCFYCCIYFTTITSSSWNVVGTQ